MRKYKILAIDIGGTHITAGLVNNENHKIEPGSILRKQVDSSGSVDSIIRQWSDIIEVLISDPLFSGKIAIAFPGPFDYINGISKIKEQGKYLQLYGLKPGDLLGNRLGLKSEDICFVNDAASFLQGEVLAGIAKDTVNAVALTLGTGLGAARFHGNYSEDAAQWQKPYRDGIAEDYFCTHWFINRYAELSGKNINGVKRLAEIVSQDDFARLVFKEFGENLAYFIQGFAIEESAEIVVLGGNISKTYNLFIPSLQHTLKSLDTHVPVMLTKLGETATLIGAADIWSNLNKWDR